jgi:hypothetical protein
LVLVLLDFLILKEVVKRNVASQVADTDWFGVVGQHRLRLVPILLRYPLQSLDLVMHAWVCHSR